jgi:3'(2'), 5'-bisphosphate nucleotidase
MGMRVSVHKDYHDWLPSVLQIARSAASCILKFYQQKDQQNFETKLKADLSPVTSADLAAHQIIVAGLLALTPDIPVLSEEGTITSFSERTRWSRYWLVDPLDGTKEFINGNDDFAVNIALIENHVPVLGVVVVPILQEAYWAIKDHPAFYQSVENEYKRIVVNAEVQSTLKVAISRRHGRNCQDLKDFIERLRLSYEGVAKIVFIECGSALKICLVASGIADIYPRFGDTGEWDTAAGQCILEAAGGILCDIKGNPLKYNTKTSLINPGFMAIGPTQLYNISCG